MVTAPTTLDDYPENAPPHSGPPDELSRADAQANFDHYMAVKGQRWQVMRDLLHDDELAPGMSDAKVQELADWYQNAVAIAPGSEEVLSCHGMEFPSYRMDSVWYCIGEDIGLMLGDVAIHRFPHLEWALCTFGGRTYINRHQLVIVGFRRAPYPKYDVPFLDLVVTHGYACAKEVCEPNWFVELLHSLAEIA